MISNKQHVHKHSKSTKYKLHMLSKFEVKKINQINFSERRSDFFIVTLNTFITSFWCFEPEVRYKNRSMCSVNVVLQLTLSTFGILIHFRSILMFSRGTEMEH